jgi:hypothetical protein
MAYPLGGIVFVICQFLSQANSSADHVAWSAMLIDFFFASIYAAFMSCVGFGFIKEFESGHACNLYPYIIPTAIVVFAILSWRHFSKYLRYWR